MDMPASSAVHSWGMRETDDLGNKWWAINATADREERIKWVHEWEATAARTPHGMPIEL